MEERNDDRFNHPERWRYDGSSVLWIADSVIGTSPIHLVYEYAGVQWSAMCARDYARLTYTAPDPWEGVELPEVWLHSGQNGKFYASAVAGLCINIPGDLPVRRFKLVPL